MTPPPPNPLLFPDRVRVSRIRANGPDGKPLLDASKGRVHDHVLVADNAPCRIVQATVELVPDLNIVGNVINTVVSFPVDYELHIDDLLEELDEAGNPTGRGFDVQRSQKRGILNMARWQADCKGRQSHRNA